MSPLLLASVFVFALAILLGVELIRKVPQTLHTPLMSGSNAISGITIVGALILITHTAESSSIWLRGVGFVAVVCAMVNVVGGFLLTDRMLRMFRRR